MRKCDEKEGFLLAVVAAKLGDKSSCENGRFLSSYFFLL